MHRQPYGHDVAVEIEDGPSSALLPPLLEQSRPTFFSRVMELARMFNDVVDDGDEDGSDEGAEMYDRPFENERGEDDGRRFSGSEDDDGPLDVVEISRGVYLHVSKILTVAKEDSETSEFEDDVDDTGFNSLLAAETGRTIPKQEPESSDAADEEMNPVLKSRGVCYVQKTSPICAFSEHAEDARKTLLRRARLLDDRDNCSIRGRVLPFQHTTTHATDYAAVQEYACWAFLAIEPLFADVLKKLEAVRDTPRATSGGVNAREASLNAAIEQIRSLFPAEGK